MNLIQTAGTTNSEGTLTLTLPLGRPDTEFEIVLVVQPRPSVNGAVAPADRFAKMDAIRNSLAATGRDFGDSAQDIREDRDR
jgi:hypothetical protein